MAFAAIGTFLGASAATAAATGAIAVGTAASVGMGAYNMIEGGKDQSRAQKALDEQARNSPLYKRDKSLDQFILEARNRIGGRVFTSDTNIDMGAAWLHGSIDNPLNAFLDFNDLIPVSKCNPWMHSENASIEYMSSNHIVC